MHRDQMLASLITYVRSHHLALLALFVALGGTAYAIESNSVRSKHIVDGQVKPKDLGGLKTAGQGEFVQLDPDSRVNGPEVDVRVPPPGLVAVYARSDIRLFDDLGTTTCLVDIDTDETSPSPLMIDLTEDASPRPLYSAPGSGEDVAGVLREADAGWIVVESTPGNRTFQLEFAAGGTACRFENTRLHVLPVG